MSEKVVYILGAGFSAPLGLPVMSNFYIKSKDMYFSDTEKYKHFLSVFDEIKKLSIIKNYYRSDLFNIEEILSIIEMQTFLEGKKLKKAFTDYISDVIEYYTPKLGPSEVKAPNALKVHHNWPMTIFGKEEILRIFGSFAANLFAAEFRKFRTESNEMTVRAKIMKNRSTQYAVITLNYDLVLENFCTFINDNYIHNPEEEFMFIPPIEDYDLDDWSCPPLAKLHGSLDTGLIVPPTWAKGNNPEITPIWKHAYQILSKTNHIRIIGYSLPIADTYIKFLLKSAIVKTEHLKTIDVICLDSDGSVVKRYDEFFEYINYRFVNANVTGYLDRLSNRYANSNGQVPVQMIHLESEHNYFMRAQKNLNSA